MATRQQIRASIKQLIAGFFTATFDFRPAQFYKEELPCSAVFFDSGESVRDFDDDTDTNAQLSLEIIIDSNGEQDTELDVFASQVEAAIRADNTLNGLVDAIYRVGFQYDRDPESLTASLTLFFKVQYKDED